MVHRRSFGDMFRPLELFLCSFLWLEGVYRFFCVETFMDRGLLYILLFSVPLAAGCTILSSVWSEKGNCIATGVILGIVSLWYMIQTVYFTIFRTVLVTKSFGMAGEAIGNYWRETLGGIWSAMPALLLMFLPLLAYMLLRRSIPLTGFPGVGALLGVAAIAAALQITAVACVNHLPSSGLMTTRELYRQTFLPDITVSKFGVMTTLRLDITQTLFGLEEPMEDFPPFTPDDSSGIIPGPSSSAVGPGNSSVVDPGSSSIIDPGSSSVVDPGGSSVIDPGSSSVVDPGSSSVVDPKPIVYEPNVLDIDFASLIANETDKTLKNMHQYFATRKPTLKNEYTGMFEGKNLIFITAEAFWIGAVNEKYTPTLYKLANESFVFKNFYNPLWWYSTIDGEYAACTGLIPSNQVNASFKYTGKNQNSMYFSMGNLLRAQGYTTTAYHNHTYTYYDRHLSHPNMGYDYYGVGNGLNISKSWPESDLEMMQATLPQALAQDGPFHNYYMTVSGHLQYNFIGNAMCKKHKAAVADLDMSEPARAYVACNIELDHALEYVLEELEKAGELENTVICISGDHYPYGLDGTGAIDELTAPGVEADLIEKYRSTLILWSGSMTEPVIVEKPCSSIDIIPTLCNLFGLEYDSRLLIGRDILSTAPGLVATNKYCFVSDYGKYYNYTTSDEFIPNEGVTVAKDYITTTFAEVKRMFTYSERILFNDYYRVLGLVPTE